MYPEDGALVPKHVADADFIFVFINTVHLVGVINGVLCYNKVRNGQL